MPSPAVLVVAATTRELEWVGPATATLACGIGPVEAAVRVGAELARARPEALLHVGIAGARGDIRPGDVVLGTVARYVDLAAAIPVVDEQVPDPALLALAARALPHARQVEIATTARVGASRSEPVEAMEGFAVLRAAAIAGVPAVELRTISNAVGDADRDRWDFDGALAALAAAGADVLAALRGGWPPGRGGDSGGTRTYP